MNRPAVTFDTISWGKPDFNARGERVKLNVPEVDFFEDHDTEDQIAAVEQSLADINMKLDQLNRLETRTMAPPGDEVQNALQKVQLIHEADTLRDLRELSARKKEVAKLKLELDATKIELDQTTNTATLLAKTLLGPGSDRMPTAVELQQASVPEGLLARSETLKSWLEGGDLEALRTTISKGKEVEALLEGEDIEALRTTISRGIEMESLLEGGDIEALRTAISKGKEVLSENACQQCADSSRNYDNVVQHVKEVQGMAENMMKSRDWWREKCLLLLEQLEAQPGS